MRSFRVKGDPHFHQALEAARVQNKVFFCVNQQPAGWNVKAAIEYGLITAGISVAIIAVVQGLGSNLKATFSSVSSALSGG